MNIRKLTFISFALILILGMASCATKDTHSWNTKIQAGQDPFETFVGEVQQDDLLDAL